MRNNKKGVGFIFIGLIILILVLSIIFIPQPPEVKEDPIGFKQYEILHQNEQAENAKIYLQNSIEQAEKIAQKDTFKTAGIYNIKNDNGGFTHSPCGEFLYPSYTAPGQECYPDFSDTYKNYMDEAYSTYLEVYSGNTQTKINHEYTTSLKQEPNKLIVQTKADSELKIPVPLIQKNDDGHFKEQTIQEAPEGEYSTGMLGRLGEERIINCSTGNCFADVANFYFQQYTADGTTIPYIWGGESPYTYKDTLYDKENNPNSFFKDAPLSEYQPGKYSSKLTKPGFDCSGWIWWVGKHANIGFLKHRASANEYYERAINRGLVYWDKIENSNEDFTKLQEEIQPGDIILYSKDHSSMDHVSIYVGDGMIIHSTIGGLKKQPLTTYKKILSAVARPKYNAQGTSRLGFDTYNEVLGKTRNILYIQDKTIGGDDIYKQLQTQNIGTITFLKINPGDTAEQVMKQTQQTIQQATQQTTPYTEAIFFITENIFGENPTTKEKEDELKKILKTTQEKIPKILLLTIPQNIGLEETDSLKKQIRKQFNNWMREQATDSINVLDLEKELKDKTTLTQINTQTQKKELSNEGKLLLTQTIYEDAYSPSATTAGTCNSLIDPSQINTEAMRYNIDMNKANKIFQETGIEKYIIEAHQRYPRVPIELIKAFIVTEVGSGTKLEKYIANDDSVKDSKGNLCNSHGYCGLMQIGKTACKSHKDICAFKDLQKGNHEETILVGTAILDNLLKNYNNLEEPNYFFLAIAYNAGPTSAKYVIEEATKRTGKPKELIQWSDITKQDVENGMSRLKASWAHNPKKWDEIYSYPNIVGTALAQQCGANTLTPPIRNYKNNIFFTPQTNSTYPINLNSLELINEFTKTIETKCKGNLPLCVKQQILLFNKKYTGKITINQYGSTDEIGEDIITQILEQINNKQTDCISQIKTNYKLNHNYEKEQLRFMQNGDVYIGNAEKFYETKKFIINLPQPLSKTYTSEENDNDYIDLIINTEDNTTSIFTDMTFNSLSETWDELFNGATTWTTDKTKNARQVDAIALLKTKQLGQTGITGQLEGPANWCDGTEGLPTTYIVQAEKEAWKSNGKTYVDIAQEQGQNKNIDPALLIAKAIVESGLGTKDTCPTSKIKVSRLTNCTWSGESTCYNVNKATVSDETQMSCTAKEFNKAYLEATNSNTESGGTYKQCQQWVNDQEKLWSCILCIEHNKHKGTDEEYQAKQPSCAYSEKIKQSFCQWENYFKAKGLETAQQQATGECSTFVEYAKKYLGTHYGGTGLCRAEDAQAGKCTTQCGNFVTNVFRYAEPGNPITMNGNGNQKCDLVETRNNKFTNALLLQPGDIFTSDGPSKAAKKWGHTGIFVGRGRVEGDAREGTSKANPNNPYCYKTFIPDPKGEPVFIHSVGPVCYSTLKQLQKRQRRHILSFCRPNVCEQTGSSVQTKSSIQSTATGTANGEETVSSVQGSERSKETATITATSVQNAAIGREVGVQSSGSSYSQLSSMAWIPYTKDYSKLLCRDGKQHYTFKASFPFTTDKIQFSVYLENNQSVEIKDLDIHERLCEKTPTLLLRWNVEKQDQPYSFTIDFSGEKNPNEYLNEIQLLASTTKETTEDPKDIETKNQIYKKTLSDGTEEYMYLFSPQDLFESSLPPNKPIYASITAENIYGTKSRTKQLKLFIYLNSTALEIIKSASLDNFALKELSSCETTNSYTIQTLLQKIQHKDETTTNELAGEIGD